MVVIKKQGSKLEVPVKVKETIEVSLPTQLSSPANHIGDYSILLYGEKKIGKTSLASKFDKALFLMFEPGGKALSVYQKPVANWAEFKKFISLIQKDKQFRTIVIDTVDIAYQMCVEYILEKLVIKHLSDEEWGKGWQACKDEFNKEIVNLLKTEKGVIFVSHAAEKEIKTRTGDQYHRISPTMSNQARDILEGIVDIWMYYGYEGKARFLWVEGNDHIGAGHRLETRFKYTDGSAIAEIPMGKSPTEAYANFIKAFNNSIQKGEDKKVVKKVVVVKK
jgi:hypothetical protein